MRFLMLNWRDPKNPLAGGAERVTLAHLAALQRRGHEVYWYANEFPNYTPEETIEGIHIVRGGGKGGSIFKAKEWYRRQKPFDLVIDQHHGIPWYAPWWCRTRCIAYIHEVLGPIWGAFYPWPLSTLGRWQERWTHWMYRNVQFWTVSDETRDILMSEGVKSVKVLRNGVDTIALATLPEKKLENPLRLVMVSRLAPNKRIDHGIQTMKCLVQKSVPARLTIIGTGESEGPLKKLVKDLGLAELVTFTGPLPEKDKNERLQQAHLLIHTSLREGWGLNVIEANAMGTPAVVYPVGGLRESTLHGETGLVAEKETPESLAESLAGLATAQDKYAGFRVNAWNRAKALHWDKVLPVACDWLEEQGGGKAKATK
jgi:glycosyltransferase involved in cell wall biosynthesis